MNRANQICRSILFMLGGLATIGFFITKNPPALAWAASGDGRYGDLYRFSHIDRFKPLGPLPWGKFANLDSLDLGEQNLNDEKIIFLGDSFGFADWGEEPFGMQLQEKLATPIFKIFNNHHDRFWKNPYQLLESNTNKPEVQRVVIYEIVERLIQYQFSTPIPDNGDSPTTRSGAVSQLWTAFNEHIFYQSETRSEVLLKHSFVTVPMIELWNTVVFELFRQLPPETPLYSLKPPMLFFRDEVNCFKSDHDDKFIAMLADNIALLDNNLQKRFGCTLIFLPVPNKVSIYHQYAMHEPYDNFLPRLCSELKTRGVRTVELFPQFQEQNELLYWPTDTHWNSAGIHLAVQQTFDEFQIQHPK